ncbi:MAG: SAM-dependent chlorinase/fluorinase [marine benthic group bacterium]|jgi:S-adenosylmethionine hydrolase|nr:SAM-dependent chlorinase/fluorinase [Gemmatimonadota bacterium]MCL7975623.1 SAM-dependent chlorinase/fluorinase [Gemmatimonadota bacterium]MCL7982816.1 SAM-dependent chlorinase/fluorinase [Gemmatimonadota bacterium]
MPIVTLITDFGTADGYVGEVKGAILSAAPGATLVDVAHDVTPGDVEAAAWVLSRVWNRYPEGTVHLVVVDPGVGGARRAMLLQSGGRWFVGPDNGVVSRALGEEMPDTAWALDPDRCASDTLSSTFHGRDLFAPAAARVAAGESPAALGDPIEFESISRLELSEPHRSRECVRGQVAHVDRFGNLVTDIPASWVSPTALIELGGTEISGVRLSYTSVDPGQLVAVIGSAGTLEISVREGSASERLSVGRGEPVLVRPERD